MSPVAASIERTASATAVQLRAMPFPYRAALAICSDLDLTPNRQVYAASARYLNTTSTTSMGRGLGLEVGNTIYFDMADQYSYWNTDDEGRDMARALIRSGHIDCLHSYGDLATTRAHAQRALDDLARHDCHLEVWVDHAVAPTNFGDDIMKGTGDLPGAEAYHADLTCAAGVRYVWRGRVTSVIGQNIPRTLAGIWHASSPLRSGRTALKEAAKGFIGRGDSRYSLHPANRIVRETTLRDGRPVYEFLRSNPHPHGVSVGDTAGGVAEVFTPRMLKTLIDREASTIVYTHLGKIRSEHEPFEAPTRRAFEHLAQLSHDGAILVTTTRRLLGYCVARERVEASMRSVDGASHIDVRVRPDSVGSLSPADVQGLTFYAADPARTRVFVAGQEVQQLQRNPVDATGRRSVTIPWTRLEFPI